MPVYKINGDDDDDDSSSSSRSSNSSSYSVTIGGEYSVHDRLNWNLPPCQVVITQKNKREESKESKEPERRFLQRWLCHAWREGVSLLRSCVKSIGRAKRWSTCAVVKDVSSWSLEFFFLKFYYSLSSSAGLLTCAFPREPFTPFPKGLAPPSLPRLLPMEHLLTYCTNATTAHACRGFHGSLSYALTLFHSSTPTLPHISSNVLLQSWKPFHNVITT